MKLGTHSAALAGALSQADQVWMYQGPNVTWDVAGSVASLGTRARTIKDLEQLIGQLDQSLVGGDHVLIMSNGGFGGIHGKLLDRLRKR
jgi:UDP-N-acetylmuramate: L-alanyl-gamma-D-glutamyl-meso-diaminopimelate ligase